jgi:Polysaccharide deacetylase
MLPLIGPPVGINLLQRRPVTPADLCAPRKAIASRALALKKLRRICETEVRRVKASHRQVPRLQVPRRHPDLIQVASRISGPARLMSFGNLISWSGLIRCEPIEAESTNCRLMGHGISSNEICTSPPTVIYFSGRFCMCRSLLVFLSVLALLVTGCKKAESNLTQSTPSPTASVSLTPVAQTTPTAPPDTNRTAKFIVLLYHRFEDRPAELVTTPNDFRAQMKALKENGISVISMQDLLAWRKGKKAIPSKSAVITLDDEWNSQYYVAWPILKEFGYPFTLFIYTQWVNTGGKSMTWAQLEEMRDDGVDIEAHTVSHHDLRGCLKSLMRKRSG